MSNGRPRRSIFGGLLLVLFGGIFLAGNFIPEFRFWHFFATFWPALLIVWGLAKLFDYFASQQSGHPTPPAFTAGEFFLLLLLLMFGASVSGFRWMVDHGGWDVAEPPWFLNHYSFTEETSLKVAKPDSQIMITNSRGDVTVVTEDIPEIRVIAQKHVTISGNEQEARERSGFAKVQIREVPGGYEVLRVDSDTGRDRARVAMDFEVHLPKQASLDVRVQRGNFSVGGLLGGITVDTQRGDVEIRDAARDVEVKINNGDARITKVGGNVRVSGGGGEIEVSDVKGEAVVEGQYSGPIRLTNVVKGGRFVSRRTDLTFGPLPGKLELGGGNVEIVDASGNVDMTTSENDVRLENVAGRVKIQNRRGKIEMRFKSPPKEELDVTNESGDVELTLPAAASFEIAASSQNGEVENEFDAPGLKKTDEHDNARLEGKVGARGPQIRVRTTYGTFSLRKSS